MISIKKSFDLTSKVCIITGGSGLLGIKHAEAVAEMGGIPILLDLVQDKLDNAVNRIKENYSTTALGLSVDITQVNEVKGALERVKDEFETVNVLINNAANNPKMEDNITGWSRFENFSLDMWNKDHSVGLTGAFICSQVFGTHMADQEEGVILNIASDLGLIAPDQRIYRDELLPENRQPVKPVTYSVIKHGLIGLTKYLATYWSTKNVRVNSLSPGGVYNGQPDDFVDRLTQLIPLNRMADVDEYKAAVVFLCSDASSYMTGANLVIDGGRTCW